MNTYNTQILKDTTKSTVIKLIGDFDGSTQENNPNRIIASSLNGALNEYGFLLSNGGNSLSYYEFTIKSI